MRDMYSLVKLLLPYFQFNFIVSTKRVLPHFVVATYIKSSLRKFHGYN